MLKFFNTLKHRLDKFKPLRRGEVKMYVCGPTVYSYDHLGHGRVGVFYDVVRRYLKFLGYKVKMVQNITDVGHLTEDEEPEDKIVREARRQGKTPLEIARFFEEKHFEAMQKLGVLPPTFSPRASEFIEEMQDFIKVLIRKGFAYESETGVYFSVSKVPDYGVLSGRTTEKEQLEGVRVDLKEDKKDPRDFALWIKADPKHLLQWDSPWGKGYPGWHIECIVMIEKLLRLPIDIHGGGVDLIFPHHENERAEGWAYLGAEPVRYF
ncbi:class I tRNA ligase family protein, partial [bacterium]|nr:class I tRNA ligase family protein [bacterium]